MAGGGCQWGCGCLVDGADGAVVFVDGGEHPAQVLLRVLGDGECGEVLLQGVALAHEGLPAEPLLQVELDGRGGHALVVVDEGEAAGVAALVGEEELGADAVHELDVVDVEAGGLQGVDGHGGAGDEAQVFGKDGGVEPGGVGRVGSFRVEPQARLLVGVHDVFQSGLGVLGGRDEGVVGVDDLQQQAAAAAAAAYG